jgi:Lrp/AsnC family transcriptional regulator, leucine-responsive regulatory protein
MGKREESPAEPSIGAHQLRRKWTSEEKIRAPPNNLQEFRQNALRLHIMAHKHLPNLIELDAIAWKIVESLQRNARVTFAELGRKVGLSTPAVAERVHRLEEAGVITGYHASIDASKLGVPIRILMRLTIPGGDLQISRTVTAMHELSEIRRCHRITGSESFVIEADVVSIRHMEALIDRLSALGATSTSTILSSPVERREYTEKQIESFAKYA